MKKIFLITILAGLKLLAHEAVENSVGNVDKDLYPCTKYAKYCSPQPDQSISVSLNYSCEDYQNGNSFKITENLKTHDAHITEFAGEDLYEGG